MLGAIFYSQSPSQTVLLSHASCHLLGRNGYERVQAARSASYSWVCLSDNEDFPFSPLSLFFCTSSFQSTLFWLSGRLPDPQLRVCTPSTLQPSSASLPLQPAKALRNHFMQSPQGDNDMLHERTSHSGPHASDGAMQPSRAYTGARLTLALVLVPPLWAILCVLPGLYLHLLLLPLLLLPPSQETPYEASHQRHRNEHAKGRTGSFPGVRFGIVDAGDGAVDCESGIFGAGDGCWVYVVAC